MLEEINQQLPHGQREREHLLLRYPHERLRPTLYKLQTNSSEGVFRVDTNIYIAGRTGTTDDRQGSDICDSAGLMSTFH